MKKEMASIRMTPLQVVQLQQPLSRDDERDIDQSVATFCIRQYARSAVADRRRRIRRMADAVLVDALQIAGPEATAQSIVASREAFHQQGFTLAPEDQIADEQMWGARNRVDEEMLRLEGVLALAKAARRMRGAALATGAVRG